MSAIELNILIIDDDPNNIRALRAAARKAFPGCRCWSAGSGAEGIEITAMIAPDVLLLDLALPDLDGLEMLRRLRAGRRSGSIPAICLTTPRTSRDARARALRAGAAGFLPSWPHPRILKSGGHDPAFFERLWRTIASGRTWTGTLVNRRKDGSRYVEDATIAPVRDAGGRTVSYVAVKRDITAQRLLEEELRQAQKMESIGRLAGGVAHDFNNILQLIMSYVELSLQKVDAAVPLRQHLLEIQRAAHRSAALTGHPLAFARKQTASPKVIDLNEAVAGTQRMIRRLIGEDIELAWLPCGELARVRIDPAQLDQIIANLAVNARDAIDGVGKLVLKTGVVAIDTDSVAAHPGIEPGDYVQLAVTDDGCGMDTEVLAHLFEPFFTTKAVGRGTGLGLATIYGIVRQNDGFIAVESEPGRGTTFRIHLPRVEAATDRSGAEELAPARTAARRPSWSSRTNPRSSTWPGRPSRSSATGS